MTKNYYFTTEHELFRQSLRTFLQKEVVPNIEKWEDDQRIPRKVWHSMGELGFLGLSYPSKYGGSDLDFFYDVVFCEETSKVFSGGFTITQLVVQYMSGPYLLKHGSEKLKQKYLPGIINGSLISCIGITEPDAGSDVLNIKTTAIRQGDNYIVNGSKTFITNGVYGDFMVTVVKTDPSAGSGGVSLLVIDLKSEGISVNKLRKLGWHASDTAELAFSNLKVPVENIIGEEGKGFYYLMGGLQIERLAGAISGYASSESALEYALQYMSERSAFGRPINKFQVLRHRAAQLASEIEMLKQFVLHCCRLNNDGIYAVKECSMAKLLSTELAEKAMTQCLQFFGGYGYMEDYKMARMFRDSRIGTIGGGTSEIMREIIAKMVIDDISYQKEGDDSSDSESLQTTEVDPFDKMIPRIRESAAKAKPLGKSLKFDFGTKQMTIDGTGDHNIINTENSPADCTVNIELSDFIKLMKGELNPMNAMLEGKLKISGDMAVAMKLQSIFK